MEIKTKFEIGQKVYEASASMYNCIVNTFIREIIISRDEVFYKVADGRILSENDIHPTYKDVIDVLLREEDRRHEKAIDYIETLKDKRHD